MNDLIRTLWRQGGGNYSPGNQNTWAEFTINNPEKFAKLIIQECINCAEHTGKLKKGAADPMDTADDIIRRINARFNFR